MQLNNIGVSTTRNTQLTRFNKQEATSKSKLNLSMSNDIGESRRSRSRRRSESRTENIERFSKKSIQSLKEIIHKYKPTNENIAIGIRVRPLTELEKKDPRNKNPTYNINLLIDGKYQKKVYTTARVKGCMYSIVPLDLI